MRSREKKMARKRRNKTGSGYGALFLIVLLIIGSCSTNKKNSSLETEQKPAQTSKTVQTSTASVQKPNTSALYGSVAPEFPMTVSKNDTEQVKANTARAKSHQLRKSNPERKNRKRRGAEKSYAAGPCPCSSNSNCVGPRGGRYCITSGGNKRYR